MLCIANVLKEIVDPAGAIIKADQFTLGDETISIVALWNAEYQESVAVLVPAHKIDILKAVAHRERCAVDVVGEITGSGKVCWNFLKIKLYIFFETR